MAWVAVAFVRVALSERLLDKLSGPSVAQALGGLSLWAASGWLLSMALAWTLERLPDALRQGGWLFVSAACLSLCAALLWAAGFERIGVQGWMGSVTASGRSGFGRRLAHGWCLFGVFTSAFLATALIRRATESRERALQAEALLHASRLETLRCQLNPHFLFNALNSLVGLVDESPHRSKEMLQALGVLLRRILSSNDGIVTLRDELEGIRLYISFENLRFEEKLVVTFDIADDVLETRIPGMLLQPLVENAVKHGMRGAELPLRVIIRVQRLGDTLVMSVSNSGRLTVAAGDVASSGVGLRNVRARLVASYPRSQRLELFEADGQVVVRIELDPKELQ